MMTKSWVLAILTILVTFITWPMESDCKEDSYNSIRQDRPHYLSSDVSRSTRYSDIDYDTFVGLMGRRSAGVSAQPSQKRDMDDVFVGLLGRRSSGSDLYLVCRVLSCSFQHP